MKIIKIQTNEDIAAIPNEVVACPDIKLYPLQEILLIVLIMPSSHGLRRVK